MATHTMQLRVLIEGYTLGEDLKKDERIEKARHKLFDFDYPIFNNNYKKTFETLFIKHFYMREIGFETEGLFKHYLDEWLNTNMPYYNQLLESQCMEFDPFVNSYLTTKSTNKTKENQTDNTKANTDFTQDEKTNTSSNEHIDFDTTDNSSFESKDNSSSEGFDRKIHTDNPDSRLQITTGSKGSGVIEYASDIDETKSFNDSETKSTGTSKNDNKRKGDTDFTGENDKNTESNRKRLEDYTSDKDKENKFDEIRKGKIGNVTYSEMLLKYRQTLINVEREIFNDMNELFMLVYS